MCSTFTLAPAASKQVTFLLAWHYPNKYVFWDQSVRLLTMCTFYTPHHAPLHLSAMLTCTSF